MCAFAQRECHFVIHAMSRKKKALLAAFSANSNFNAHSTFFLLLPFSAYASVSRCLILRVIISPPVTDCNAYDCVTKNALWRTLSSHFFSLPSFIIMHKNFTSSPVIMTLAMQFFLAFVPCAAHTRSLCFPVNYPDRFFAFFFFLLCFHTMRKKLARES